MAAPPIAGTVQSDKPDGVALWSGPHKTGRALTVTCTHLKELYQVCQQHNIKLGSSDLIRMVCPQCGIEENCPSVYTAEYDARHQDPGPGQESAVEETGETSE